MKVAFFQASHTHKRFNENFFVVDRHFGVFPDVGMATAAEVARRSGADVRIWDAYASGMSLEDVAAEVRGWGPDIVGFAFHSVPTIRDALGWAARIKEATGVPVVAGGHETGRYTREVMAHDAVDYTLVGRAVSTLPAFLEAVRKDSGYERVPGLAWRGPSGIVVNPAPEAPDGETEPGPARDLIDNRLYFSHVTQRGLYTVLLTSRGCPFGCSFCAVARSGYHPRAVDDVVDEMEHCIERHSVHEFDLFDPLLLHDRRRILDLAAGIRARRLDMEWACRSRVDDVDEELLGAMADSGCRRIYYGIESGDPEVLRRIGKRIDLAQVERAIAMTRDHGIRPLGFFQIGGPGETVRSARRTIRFALDLPLDYAQFMRTIAKPGSDLEEVVKRTTGTDPWREYVLGIRGDERLPAPWTRLDGATVDRLVREAYLRFYLRPGIMLHTLGEARSAAEAARYVRVGLAMLLRGAEG